MFFSSPHWVPARSPRGSLIGLDHARACGPGQHSAGTPSPRRYFSISRRMAAWQHAGKPVPFPPFSGYCNKSHRGRSVQTASEQMIEQQVRAWDVLEERVLRVLREVPRERFVPPEQRYRAYADVEVPLPCGQHMLRPSVTGRLLQGLAPRAGESVLEIGAGTGFITPCLPAMGGEVPPPQIFPELAQLPRPNL